MKPPPGARAIILLASVFIRKANLNSQRFEQFELPSTTIDRDRRGVINEIAFRLFAKAHLTHVTISELDELQISESESEAISFINRLRAAPRDLELSLEENEEDEAIKIGKLSTTR